MKYLAWSPLLLLLSYRTSHDLIQNFNLSNAKGLEGVRFVMMHTGTEETVMDGFMGYGVFRLHADYYFFLHEGMIRSLSYSQKSRILNNLVSGRSKPKLVLFDHNLRNLSPEWTAFMEQYYEPVGVDPILLRKDNEVPP